MDVVRRVTRVAVKRRVAVRKGGGVSQCIEAETEDLKEGDAFEGLHRSGMQAQHR